MRVGAAVAGVAAVRPAWSGEPSAPETLQAQNLIEPTHALLGSMRATALGPFLADWPVANERRGQPAIGNHPIFDFVADINEHGGSLFSRPKNAPGHRGHRVHREIQRSFSSLWAL